MDNNGVLLSVRELSTHFFTGEGIVKAVQEVGFSIKKGQTFALVGESGCGKSTTALSIMRLVPSPQGKIIGGQIVFEGRNLLALSERQMRQVRGNRIAMIFQEPMTSLNPVFTLGNQIAEAIKLHQKKRTRKAWAGAVEMLGKVGIADAAQRAREYPHQMSGGMRQRVMIAMAVSCRPALLIADEPTTALDAMVQAQILDLLDEQQKQNGMSILLITHNLGIVAQRADDVAVMYASRIVEVGDSQRLFAEPLHPYTRGLIYSLCVERDASCEKARFQSLTTHYALRRTKLIPGAVPEPLHFPAGCKFHPRCPTGYKDKRCQTFEPELKEVGQGRCVACWYAPGYERDASCVMRRASYAIRTTKYALRNDIMNQPMTNIDGYLLKVNNLKTYFPIKRGLLRRTVGYVKAVDGISFGIRAGRSPAPDRARLRRAGQTLGLVGESGCGKTTVARSIVRLVPATAGEVVFDGIDVLSAGKNKLRQIRRQIGLIFQDPYSSLNPRMTIGDIVGEPLKVQSHWGHQVVGWKNGDVRERVAVLLSKVGLSPEHINRYPHEFSGGQRQRIGVARALALEPKLVICDEPVSSLDVSIQSQILNLLKDLQQELGLTYLFIAHDLAVVEFFCDIVAVMYMGKIVEQAEAEELYRNPLHPYTQALMSAIPRVEPSLRGRRTVPGGEAPSILSPPHVWRTGPSAGCAFHSRCPLADGDCLKQTSVLEEKSKGHFVACWKCKKIDY